MCAVDGVGLASDRDRRGLLHAGCRLANFSDCRPSWRRRASGGSDGRVIHHDSSWRHRHDYDGRHSREYRCGATWGRRSTSRNALRRSSQTSSNCEKRRASRMLTRESQSSALTWTPRLARQRRRCRMCRRSSKNRQTGGLNAWAALVLILAGTISPAWPRNLARRRRRPGYGTAATPARGATGPRRWYGDSCETSRVRGGDERRRVRGHSRESREEPLRGLRCGRPCAHLRSTKAG